MVLCSGMITLAIYADGKDGNGIVDTIISYSLSDSGASYPNTGWQDEVPELVQGKYLWTRTTLVYSDGTQLPSYAPTYISKDGVQGEQGPKGEDLVKEPGISLSCSNDSFILSGRGVCKTRQTITFYCERTLITDTVTWNVYIDNELVNDTLTGDSISIDINVNDTFKSIIAEATAGEITKTIQVIGQSSGDAMPERVIAGYSDRIVPSSVIQSITTLDDGVSLLIEGDYALVGIVNSDDKIEPTPYRYTGTQWAALEGYESNASEIFFALQNDALTTDETKATASIIVAWIKNLVSQNAFIESLKIKNGFSSTEYEEDSNGIPTKGWKGDTDSGTLKSYKMVSNGMTAYDATIIGSIEHASLKTIPEGKPTSVSYSTSDKTYWSWQTFMESLPRYAGSASTYQNAFRSGAITYNGVTYEQYYSKMWDGNPEKSYTYRYTKHVDKNSGGNILSGGDSGESIASIAERAGITTLQANEAVRLNFHCSGATTTFTFYINGVESYSEKVDGVGVFNGWLRPTDVVRIYCKNSNLFNERDLTCDVTVYQVGYPMQPLTASPVNLIPGPPADIGEDYEDTSTYVEQSWIVPTGKLINQAWVSFNANVYGAYETLAELYVNRTVVASSSDNTDWYKFNWKVTVKGGDTVTLRVYSIRYADDPNRYYYFKAYGVMCAFGYANQEKGLYLQQPNGSATCFLPFYSRTAPNGWTNTTDLTTSLVAITREYLIGDGFISELATKLGSSNMNKELMLTGSSIKIDGTAYSIDRAKLTSNELSFRKTTGEWQSIVKLEKMGLYKSLEIVLNALSQILSIETASIVPNSDSAYQIGTPAKRFNSAYIKEYHINGWRMSVSNGELTFIYEG